MRHSEEIVARLELDSNSNLASFYFGDTPPTGGANVTSTPALEGEPLFVRASDAEQHIAGFEFCCGQNGTLEAHEFTNVTGDFAKLDGGWWGFQREQRHQYAGWRGALLRHI